MNDKIQFGPADTTAPATQTLPAEPVKKPYTLEELRVLRRQTHRDMLRAKRGSTEESGHIRMLAEIDLAFETRSAEPPVRSALPLKKQRALGMIAAVAATAGMTKTQ